MFTLQLILPLSLTLRKDKIFSFVARNRRAQALWAVFPRGGPASLQAYLVLPPAAVFYQRAQPGDALLPSPPPQQGLFILFLCFQENAQQASSCSVHVVEKSQAVLPGDASQGLGQEVCFLSIHHVGGLDKHVVALRGMQSKYA